MRKFSFELVALASVALVSACDSDGSVVSIAEAGADATAEGAAPTEGGTPVEAGAPLDSSTQDAPSDSSAPTPPSRLLLSYNGGATSELAAFGLASGKVDGHLVFNDFLGAAYVGGGSSPWLLEQSTDVVARLDPQQPWVVASSWNVAMNDLTDAGYAQPYADPQAVIVSGGTKAYVLRYNRNLIGILDTAANVDGGAPATSIDLSGEVQAAGDGYVQPVAGMYVAAQKRVYVVLANIDRTDVVNMGYDLLCASTTPTVVAIDTTTDTLVDLNGAAAGHGWPLDGYSPLLGPSALAYDPGTGTSGRLLIVDAGCYQADPGADSGVGPQVKAEIESLDLATGTATKLLDLVGQGFPSGVTYIDAHHAIVALDTAYAWDPTTSTLGAAIPNAPDAYVYDGTANLLGLKGNYEADGGFAGYDVVSVKIADGTVTKLGSNPFTLTGGFLGGVTLWPTP